MVQAFPNLGAGSGFASIFRKGRRSRHVSRPTVKPVGSDSHNAEVFLMKRAPAVILGVVVLLLGAGLLYYRSLCACVSLVQVGRAALAQENRHALDAQQIFFAQHGRYARTLIELDYQSDSTISLEIVPLSDSSIVIKSTFLPRDEVKCNLAVSPGLDSLGGLDCEK